MSVTIKKEIENLLSKPTLTGDDVGRLMILDLLSVYKNLNEGGDGEALLTDAQKTELVNGLLLPDEIQRFNDYRGLHDYLTSAPAVADSFAKAYEVYQLKLLRILKNMMQSEEERHLFKQRPVVMTQKQYEMFIKSGDAPPLSGIAVLREDLPLPKTGIDENGFYHEPPNEHRLDNMAENVLARQGDFISELLNGMKDMLAECFARQKALWLVASYTKIPQIKMLITPVDLDALAFLNDSMFKIIKNLQRDDKIQEEYIKNRFAALLVPINPALLEPSAQSVKKARRMLNFSVIKNNSEAFVASLKRSWRDDC